MIYFVYRNRTKILLFHFKGVIMSDNKQIKDILSRDYKLGFETLVESDTFPKGLNEDVIKAISIKKDEPQWLLDFRLRGLLGGRCSFW